MAESVEGGSEKMPKRPAGEPQGGRDDEYEEEEEEEEDE